MKCPDCDYTHKKLPTFQQHLRRVHNKGYRAKSAVTDPEERRQRQREYERKHREKEKKKKTISARNKEAFKRDTFDEKDADSRGVYMAKKPIVEYRESLIPNAGFGLFASVDLEPGDVVTGYEGTLVTEVPEDGSYTIQVSHDDPTKGYIEGIRKPIRRKSMASFMNKKSRIYPGCRKNCKIVTYPNGNMYLTIIKKVKAGSELYTVYSVGYRL